MHAEHAAARANASSNRNGSVIVIPLGELTGKLEIRYAQWDIGRGLKAAGYITTEVWIVESSISTFDDAFFAGEKHCRCDIRELASTQF
jgi:hypothetical protein